MIIMMLMILLQFQGQRSDIQVASLVSDLIDSCDQHQVACHRLHVIFTGEYYGMSHTHLLLTIFLTMTISPFDLRCAQITIADVTIYWMSTGYIWHIGRLVRMSVLDTEVDGSNPGSSMLFP